MKHLMDIGDLSTQEIDALCRTATAIIEQPDAFADRCRGKKLATLFYEPSTRTRLSFEAAMLELGGSVLGFSSAQNASVAKGESVADTARIVSLYADIIAMRHPLAGAPVVASSFSSVPVINAGDGSHCHPTQTLADLLTIYREKGSFDHLTVGCCGDLKYGRTVHSLLRALARYQDIRFVLISPPALALPDYIKKDVLDKAGIAYCERESLEEAVPDLDVLYMTRVQKERFDDGKEYERLKDTYVLTPAMLQSAKDDMIVMHPLPRVGEIDPAVDRDRRAAYFREALNGKFMRMALILHLLKAAEEAAPGERVGMGREALFAEEGEEKILPGQPISGYRCANKKCILTVERGLPPRFTKEKDGKVRCAYCDEEADRDLPVRA